MPHLDYLGPDDVDDPGVRETMAADLEAYGRVGLLKRVLAHAPDVFEARERYFGALMDAGSVERELLELAHITVSYRNECRYAAASHAQKYVEALGGPRSHVEAIARGETAPFDERQAAVVSFADQVATDPKGVTDDHLGALVQAGFSDGEIVELLNWICHIIDANAFVDAMDIRPSDHSDELAEYYLA